jgi:carbon-monoxide dehydrogenase medium subunit
MKAPDFSYHAPQSCEQALDLLSRLDNARLLAGGQSLMPMLNFRLLNYDHFIDLGRISDLQGIDETPTHILIKAMTSQRQVESSDIIHRSCPLMIKALHHVGHQQTRNRGTIGGSLCHLDPGAELPVVAAALEAELIILSPRGTKRIAFADFAQGYLTNALEADELLYAIEIKKSLEHSGSAFLEFNRRPADFAIVSIAVEIIVDEKHKIINCALALGGVQHVPLRLHGLEQKLIEYTSLEDMSKFINSYVQTIEMNGDDLYPPEFRCEVAQTIVRRGLSQAYDEARGGQ